MRRTFFRPSMDDEVRLPLLQALKVWYRDLGVFSGVASGTAVVLESFSSIYLLRGVGPFPKPLQLSGRDVADILSGQFELGYSEDDALPVEAYKLDRVIEQERAVRGTVSMNSGILKLAEMLPKSAMLSIFASEKASFMVATRGEEQFIIAFPKDAATETEEDGEQFTGFAADDLAGDLRRPCSP